MWISKRKYTSLKKMVENHEKDLKEQLETNRKMRMAIEGTLESSDMDLLAEVDATVKSVCKIIQERNMPNGEYANTVKALAALVEARALLDLGFAGKSICNGVEKC